MPAEGVKVSQIAAAPIQNEQSRGLALPGGPNNAGLNRVARVIVSRRTQFEPGEPCQRTGRFFWRRVQFRSYSLSQRSSSLFGKSRCRNLRFGLIFFAAINLRIVISEIPPTYLQAARNLNPPGCIGSLTLTSAVRVIVPMHS